MVTKLSELKDFILWAKKQGLKSVKIKDLSFEIHDITIASESDILHTPDQEPVSSSVKYDSKTWADKSDLDSDKDDELDFWSAN